MEHSAFPSDETLAAFIDGRLDEETRKRVVAHVADCEDCYGTFEAAGAWQRESAPIVRQTSAFAPRRNRPLIGLAAAAVIAVFLYQPLSHRYQQHRDLTRLRDAANEMPNRIADARLSLDLSYQEKAPRYRGAGEKESDESDSHDALQAAAAQVGEDVRADIASRHSLGIALLLTGNRYEAAKVLGKAVVEQTGAASLSDAIKRCTDVSLLNDLSAAHGAVTDFNPNEASKRIALDAAKRAWQLDPKSPVTAWNRAVAIGRFDTKEAAAAWRDYLAIDATSRWNAEAKDRLAPPEESR